LLFFVFRAKLAYPATQNKERSMRLCFSLLCFVLVSITQQADAADGRIGAEPAAYTNSIGMEFALIPAGSIPLKTGETNMGRDDVYGAKATITRPFYLGK
jgi:formylglycine-generating enzyme required for sulfatase activity